MTDPRRCLNPRVVVTRELPDPIMERMAALFDTQLNRSDEKMHRDELAAAMADCDVLVPTVTDAIDADLIASAGPRLKLIANFGAGVNHIDLKAARARGII
ncbi:MAG TPA: D-glycerate dehydrogenase, partial [Sphingomonas sanguinis]|nr:D-glycerate dehydrogenase [Sphingomonas sanguinis]